MRTIRRDDERLTTSYETIPSPDGHGFIKGYLVRPFSADSRSETSSQLPGIIVVHENRGLNPHTEQHAVLRSTTSWRLRQTYTSVGGYPGDDYLGGQLFRELDPEKRLEDILACSLVPIFGITGFCYGGSVSNQVAVRLGNDLAAAVPFYGSGADAADVPNIKAAVLVQHGALD